jgi:hypothetical protein
MKLYGHREALLVYRTGTTPFSSPGSGGFKASLGSLTNKIAFKFGKCSCNVKKELSCWRCCVDGIDDAAKTYISRF